VRVHDPRTSKGLEFDDVIVVAPDEIVASSSVGAHQLYVAVTRATRSLTVIAAPEAAVPGAAHLEAGQALD
jgi:DNA helicase IV